MNIKKRHLRVSFFLLHSKKRIASIIVLSVIIATGALFTAVYDVLYKYNTTNTTILNAATVDKTGETKFSWDGDAVGGSAKGPKTVTLNFDQGTYMILFAGENPSGSLNGGVGAVCIAFYKGNSMTAQVRTGGGLGSYKNGGGKTVVTTNFALPNGYNGEYQAMAAGGGAFDMGLGADDNGRTFNVVDGTFAGWEADGWAATMQKIGLSPNHIQGTPATQTHDGWLVKYISDTEGTAGFIMTPNYTSGNDIWGGKQGLGGGAGYFDGGACVGTQYAGGGSCTPWCYPLQSSDIQSGPKRTNGERCRKWTWCGDTNFLKIDPDNIPSGANVNFGGTAKLTAGIIGERTPREFVKGYAGEWYTIEPGRPTNYDCGIRVGWVYSCSEDGEKWGACSDRLRSETKQDVWRECDR